MKIWEGSGEEGRGGKGHRTRLNCHTEHRREFESITQGNSDDNVRHMSEFTQTGEKGTGVFVLCTVGHGLRSS